MLAFIYALITGPWYGLIALLRSWMWILAVMGAFAMIAEIEQPIVAIFLLILAMVFMVLLGFSIARESINAVHGEWAIHADVPWMSAMWKYIGASLLAGLWTLLVVGIAFVIAALLVRDVSPDMAREIPYYLMEKAQNPYGTVPGYEIWDRIFLIAIFALGIPAAVFTTTYVAAAAGNGVLSRYGWVIGRGTLRMTIAAAIYGWLSWHLYMLLLPITFSWAFEIAAAVLLIASWGLNWAMLMGCAAQIYLRRLEWDLGHDARAAEAAFAPGEREFSARAIREAWMSDNR